MLLVLAAGVFLAAALVPLSAEPDGYRLLWVRARQYTVTCTQLALVALSGAALLGLRTLLLRVSAFVTLAVLGLPLLLSLAQPYDAPETHRAHAPGRDDRRMVVVRGSAGIDPLWIVYVQQGEGLAERRWFVTSFNGDSQTNELVDARWTAPDRIRMTTREGRVVEATIASDGSREQVFNDRR